MKILPHSEEAERMVIGILLAYPDMTSSAVEYGITDQWFYLPHYRETWDAIIELYAADKPVSIQSVEVFMRDRGALDRCGGLQMLEAAFDSAPTSVTFEHFASVLKWRWKQRKVIELSQSMIDRIGTLDDDEVDTYASKQASKLLEISRATDTFISPDQHAEQSRLDWIKAANGESVGLQSKWLPVENMLGSYRLGETIIIGARPSCGKSTIMANEAEHKAELGIPVGIYSLEMSEDLIRKRMACAKAKTSLFRLMRGHATPDQIENAYRELKRLARLPIYICDRREKISKIEAWMTYAYEKWGIKQFWLDYIQLIQSSSESSSESWRTREVGEWCARIKERGKRLKISTVILSQFSRTGHKLETENTPAAPTLEALRDSGELEQHADSVVLVYKKPDMPKSSFSGDVDWPMEWNFAKNRNGPTGEIPMHFIRKEQRYVTENEWNYMQREKSCQNEEI